MNARNDSAVRQAGDFPEQENPKSRVRHASREQEFIHVEFSSPSAILSLGDRGDVTSLSGAI